MYQAQAAPHMDAELGFKRFILQKTKEFAHEPQADLFRVNMLGQMLDRYDELLAKGLGQEAALWRVQREYFDIAEQMREMGFEEITEEEEFTASRWPQMTENEAAQYLKESDACLHKRALGVAMCASCVFPLMIGAGIGGMYGSWRAEEAMSMIGMVGMFAMIAVGVYSMTQAKKPKKEEAVKKGRFSLSARLRRKLQELCEAVEEKARRRTGKGIAMLVGCVAPIFIGGALDSMFLFNGFEAFSVFGVAGMFIMIGAGVYELVMADGEKKTVKKLLGKKKE